MEQPSAGLLLLPRKRLDGSHKMRPMLRHWPLDYLRHKHLFPPNFERYFDSQKTGKVEIPRTVRSQNFSQFENHWGVAWAWL